VSSDLALFLLIGAGVLWLALFVAVIVDLASSTTLSPGAKAVWVLIILMFPLLGAVAYWIVARDGAPVPETGDAGFARVSALELEMDADRLERAHQRLVAGEISQSDFDAVKQGLAGPRSGPTA